MSGTKLDWLGATVASGRYRVTEKLGSGGMGAVYRAHDDNLNADVVIKVPHPILLRDERFSERFRREVHSLVSLSHAHVVKVLDVGEHEGLPFAIMQYLSGGSLEERMVPGEGVAAMWLAEWLPQIAKALDFVYRRGYVHRDVKPANILFDSDDNPYVGDFGVAKVVTEASEEGGLTTTGGAMGTLPYMAPELWDAEPLDGRADQYALAATVYELVSGRMPFSGTARSIMGDKLRPDHQPPRLDAARPELPKPLSDALARGMAADRESRFDSCTSFSQAVLSASDPSKVQRPAQSSAPPPLPPPIQTPPPFSAPTHQRETATPGNAPTPSAGNAFGADELAHRARKWVVTAREWFRHPAAWVGVGLVFLLVIIGMLLPGSGEEEQVTPDIEPRAAERRVESLTERNTSASRVVSHEPSLTNRNVLIVPDNLRQEHPELILLIEGSQSMDSEERQYWVNLLPIMTPEQIKNLRDILENEKEQLERIDRKYK